MIPRSLVVLFLELMFFSIAFKYLAASEKTAGEVWYCILVAHLMTGSTCFILTFVGF